MGRQLRIRKKNSGNKGAKSLNVRAISYFGRFLIRLKKEVDSGVVKASHLSGVFEGVARGYAGFSLLGVP